MSGEWIPLRAVRIANHEDKMPLTKNAIAIQAERYGFTIVGFAPGLGTRADITLRDEHSIAAHRRRGVG